MKRKLIYILCAILLTTIFSSCTKSDPYSESPYTTDTFSHASIEIIDNSLMSTGIVFILSYNGNKSAYTGDWYMVESYIDGKWYSIPAQSDMEFTSEAYPVTNEKPLEMKID